MQVNELNVDDYKKLCHCVYYLRGTRDLPLRLRAGKSNMVQCWVDTSNATHPNIRSQIRCTIPLGKRLFYSASTKHKINTKLLTEAELVGVDNIINLVLWMCNLLLDQEYKLKNNILHQVNHSAILLETNGRLFSGECIKHIDVRYFYITDKVQKK